MCKVILNSFVRRFKSWWYLADLERNYDSKSNYPVEFVNVPLNSPSGNFDVWILI